MGQFHTDFRSDTGRSDVDCAVESVMLMKKMYVDKLRMSDGSFEFMTRAKGITLKSIQEVAKSYDGDIVALYKELYHGKVQKFDLTAGQVMFSMNKNMTVSTIPEFIRTVEVKYSEGKPEDYFLYCSCD